LNGPTTLLPKRQVRYQAALTDPARALPNMESCPPAAMFLAPLDRVEGARRARGSATRPRWLSVPASTSGPSSARVRVEPPRARTHRVVAEAHPGPPGTVANPAPGPDTLRGLHPSVGATPARDPARQTKRGTAAGFRATVAGSAARSFCDPFPDRSPRNGPNARRGHRRGHRPRGPKSSPSRGAVPGSRRMTAVALARAFSALGRTPLPPGSTTAGNSSTRPRDRDRTPTSADELPELSELLRGSRSPRRADPGSCRGRGSFTPGRGERPRRCHCRERCGSPRAARSSSPPELRRG